MTTTTHPFRTAPDGYFYIDAEGEQVTRRRTEHIVRPTGHGTVRLADPRTLRDDQWRAAVDAQAARFRAFTARIISDGTR